VKSASRLGFSLDEIAELLRPEDGTAMRGSQQPGRAQAQGRAGERMADLAAQMEASAV